MIVMIDRSARARPKSNSLGCFSLKRLWLGRRMPWVTHKFKKWKQELLTITNQHSSKDIHMTADIVMTGKRKSDLISLVFFRNLFLLTPDFLQSHFQ
jgi:hypothetical protein